MSDFPLKRTFGNHSILSYDTKTHPFRQYIEALYGTADLENLHTWSADYNKTDLQDIETDLHKKFYADIHVNPQFKRLYCQFIKAIYYELYPGEEFMIYQSFPSIRFQFINNTTVPPHCDSDELGRHPLGERNFLIPLTAMYGTNRLFIESEPGKKDYEGITLNPGELFVFDGNRCVHYNENNVEPTLRISLDFRVIHRQQYLEYLSKGPPTTTNPRNPKNKREPTRMVIGGYYQCAHKTDSLEDMMVWHRQPSLLLQSQPNFDIAEADACYEYMKDGTNFVTEFKQTEKLEKTLAEFIGVKHVLMTTSGTMAIVLALLGCGINPGDDVIVPDYTMIATVNAVKIVGANPVFADVDPSRFVLTKALIQKAQTPKTKAVLFVSLNNRQVDLLDIQEYCNTNNIILIEDAAQSLGCRTNGKHFGTFGNVGCFSLSTPKIISTGQGGFVVTNDDNLAKTMSMVKNFGRISGGVDVFDVFGLNMKFTDIQAVIGLEQMKKLPERVKQMRTLYDKYTTYLKGAPVKMIEAHDAEYIPWFIDIYTNHRNELATFLKLHNIQTRPTYPEIHTTPMYSSASLDSFPVTSYVSTHGLFLPSHTLLTSSHVQFICRLIHCYFGTHPTI
jgi:perosamine synthetase